MRVVCCFLECDGKFLIVARLNPRTSEHEWDLPADKVGGNESSETAAIRIVLEETGYEARPPSLELLGNFEFISGGNEPYTMLAYRLRLREPFETNKKLKCEWVTPEDCLAKPNLIKNLRQLLELTGYAKQPPALRYNTTMQELRFSVEIRAPKEKVWDTLWQDETLREWAGIIDSGTYMVGELKEGKEVQFISAENGYGVTSLVEKLVPGEFVLLRHQADTQDRGAQSREKQWSGGKESYSLAEQDDITTVTAAFDVPPELEAYFKANYPKALERVKALAERQQ